MSDTVKLIIEIPKVPKNDHERWVLAHGTPLDDVKAEIREQQKEYQECGWAYDDVLEILDNIGKGDSK